jgi:Spy/CpxP family protein refolding chaperone
MSDRLSMQEGSTWRRYLMRYPMRMRKTWQGVLVGIVVVTLWTAGGYAQDRGMGHWGGGGYGDRLLLRLFSKVGLTDDQKVQMKAVMERHRPAFQQLRQQLHAARAQITDKLLSPGPISSTDQQSLIELEAPLLEQLVQEGISTVVDLRALLTPDQLVHAAQTKDQLNTLHSQMRSLMGGQQ